MNFGTLTITSADAPFTITNSDNVIAFSLKAVGGTVLVKGSGNIGTYQSNDIALTDGSGVSDIFPPNSPLDKLVISPQGSATAILTFTK
jgi:hypothetical protein